jgi:hypothetical protein
MAMKEIFETFFDAYDSVFYLMYTLQARNLVTHVDIHHLCSRKPRICIKAFRYCRLMFYVYDTFLTGKYRGQILAAIGVDVNDQIIPCDMFFVESENIVVGYGSSGCYK